MFSKIDIQKKLKNKRDKKYLDQNILDQVRDILEENETRRLEIKSNLGKKVEQDNANLNLDLLNSEDIYHIDDIKALCIDYRLRFLDSHYFKGEIPEEAISKIRHLEDSHGIQLKNFKIMAPSKLLKLENADDPLLFIPIGNDYFYFIHKWGNDLHAFRKLSMWPYRNFENLVLTILLLSMLLTAITPMEAFTQTVSMQEYLLMFLFMFKAVAGIVLFYGFAKGKNFNNAIWNSKYYNA